MFYRLTEPSKRFDIKANSIPELELALSYLNPRQLHHANSILKRDYKLIALGIGPDIECISPQETKALACEVSVIFVKSHKQANQ